MITKTLLVTAALSLATVKFGYADILIGIGAPITGGSAAVGEQIRRGAQLAAQEMNAKGGIDGQKVELELGDDASEPRQGLSVANKFVADGVKFVVGHFNSGVSIPASAVYAENGVLEVTPGSTNPQFTEQGLWNTVRVCGRDDQQGKVAADYIVKNFHDQPLAIINDRTPYGAGLAGEVTKDVNAAGIKEVVSEGVTVGDKDFSALIDKMKAAGVKVIFFGGVYAEAGLIVRQSGEQGLKAVLIGGDGMASSEFGQITGKAGEGTLMTFSPDPRLNPNAVQQVKAFRDGGFEPEAYTLYAYAAMELIKAGIEQSHSTDPQTVSETLKSGKPFNTVLGTLAFDDKGDRKDEDYTMYQWKTDKTGKLDYVMMK